MDLNFRDDEIERYGRQILLPDIGATGQARLRAGRVLVVGAGGLGSPLLLYLAVAGIGRIGIVDNDRVALSNLNRQIAHTAASLGEAKTSSAAREIKARNADPVLDLYDTRMDAQNCDALIAQYDVVCDGSDNPETRFLLADACLRGKRILISAAVRGFEGQLSTFKPHISTDAPCYRCLYPEPPPGGVENCTDAGIMGSVTGVMGSLQATEVIKELAQIGQSLSGRLLLWNALTSRFRTITIPRDPGCRACNTRH